MILKIKIWCAFVTAGLLFGAGTIAMLAWGYALLLSIPAFLATISDYRCSGIAWGIIGGLVATFFVCYYGEPKIFRLAEYYDDRSDQLIAEYWRNARS